MGTNTITLYRMLTAPTERIYRTFWEPDAMCRWMTIGQPSNPELPTRQHDAR